MIGRGIGIGSTWGLLAKRAPISGSGWLLPRTSDTSRENLSALVWNEWYFYAGIRTDAAAIITAAADLYVEQYQELAGEAGTISATTADLTVIKPYSDTVLDDSPIGYWKLDQASGTTCTDSSGNGRNITYQGTPRYREAGPIDSDSSSYAIGFDAVNYENAWSSYVAWQTVASPSIEIWVKSSETLSAYKTIFGFGSSNTLASYLLWVDASGYPQATVRDLYGNTRTASGSVSILDGQFHHLVLACDALTSWNLKLYVDGAQVGSTTAPGYEGSIPQTANFRIGSCDDQSTRALVGEYAHAALYNGQLSAARVLAHYSAAEVNLDLVGAATSVATATGDLNYTNPGMPLDTAAEVVATATGGLTLAQALMADAAAQATALGVMPTPSPGFGLWARSIRPFARYGQAVVFSYRQYFDEANALASAAQAIADAAGDLVLTVIGIAANAAALSTATGDVSVSMAEELSGAAVAQVTATGDLSPHPVAGTAQAVVTAAGTLAALMPLASAAAAKGDATGALSNLVAIASAASALAAASAALGQSILLSGDAQGVAAAAASMAMGLGVSGDAAGKAAASGQIGAVSNLDGVAQAVATVVGALDQSIVVAGAAQAVATAAGGLASGVALGGAATAQASATGALTLAQTITGGITYAVNLKTGAVTTFDNFDFERLVHAHGKTYGLKAGVLYRVEGTEDPGATEIPVTIRCGASTLGEETLQRLDKVYVRSREREGIALTPIYDEVVGRTYYPRAGVRDGMIKHRVAVGLNNHWHTLGLRLTNLNGGAIDLGGFEFLTAPLSPRIP